MNRVSYYLTVGSMACLPLACLCMLYPFQFSPPTITSYAIVFGAFLLLSLLLMIPSSLFLLFCWRRYSQLNDSVSNSVLLLGSASLALVSGLGIIQSFTLSKLTDHLGHFLLIGVAIWHFGIFIISFFVLYFINQRSRTRRYSE